MCEPLCKIGVLQEPMPRSFNQRAEEPIGNKTEVVEKKDVSNVCSGYGRELCYKICRLHHYEPIEMCLCACCKCKF